MSSKLIAKICLSDEQMEEIRKIKKQIEELSRRKCGNCKYHNAETKGCKRNPGVEAWEENDYCSYWADMRGEER